MAALSSTAAQLYVQWARFQRRPTALQRLIDYDLHFIDSGFRPLALRPVDYVAKAVKTLAVLGERRRDVIWFAAPPIFPLLLGFLFRAVSRNKFLIVVDCHNGTFLPPWARFPGMGALLRAADLCVVHTAFARGLLDAYGVRSERIAILEDLPPQRAGPSAPVADGSAPIAARTARPIERPYVVIATSFRPDQPVELFAELARRLDGVTVVVTGDRRRRNVAARLRDAPPNLILAGYLEPAAFDALLGAADAIIGLTLRQNAVVSAAAEGLGFNVPLVLSDTQPLRAGFPKGAVFVDTASPQAVADGVMTALASKTDLKRQLADLLVERIADCHGQVGALLARLNATAQARGVSLAAAAAAAEPDPFTAQPQRTPAPIA
jgi:hypothetical protein